jgi:hypothetical protein
VYGERARAWDSKVRDVHEWLGQIGCRAPKVGPFDSSVTVTYHESLVLRLEKANSSAPLSTSVEEKLVPAKGEKPAGVAKRTIKATVAVDSINLEKREITVHNSDGSAQTFHIRDPKNVEGRRATINVTYSRPSRWP